MQVKIKILNENATIPAYGTEFSAGADIYAMRGESVIVPPHGTVLIHTGFAAEIPQGYVGLIFARSGMATKRHLAPANKVGVIDSDYRGEFMVSLHNHSDAPATVEGGERIAQLVIVPYIQAEFCPVADLSETGRGAGGFGSTGR